MFKKLLKETPTLIENNLVDYFNNLDIPDNLKEALIYASKSGGKKLRPFLFFSILSIYNFEYNKYVDIASSLEMIHTYSLIHDDLPAMDDDDLRRGKPTLHKKYNEATAILAGDAMLTHAFDIIVNTKEQVSNLQKINIIKLLTESSGACGMIAGQQLDMDSENMEIKLKELDTIHIKKTGELLKASILAGCIVANVNEATTQKLKEYALLIGKAFQIKDDILDVESSTEVLGKLVGSDENNDKSTYPKLCGLKMSKEILQKTILDAKLILKQLEIDNSVLNDICDYIEHRAK